MKTRTPRKRYKTEAEIVAKIDHCHAESKRIGTQADSNELEAKELFRRAALEKRADYASAMVEQGKKLQREAKKMRKREASLIDGTARRLGEKLSEFRTVLIPLGVGDETVPQ